MTKAILRRLLVFVLMVAATTAMADAINYSDGQVHDLTVEDGDTADSIALSAASRLNLNGGALTNLTADLKLSGGSTLYVGSGASLLAGVEKTGTTKLVNIKGGSKLVVDGGTVTLPATTRTSGASVANGTTYLEDNGSEIKVVNGGTVKISGTCHGLTMMGQTKVTVVDSAFNLTGGGNLTYSWNMSGGSHVVAVTNSTVNFYKLYLGGNSQGDTGAASSKLLFHNATVKTGVKQDTYNRGFTFYGGTYDCKNNLVRFSGSDGTSNVGFDTNGTKVHDNTIELCGGSFGGIMRLISGRYNKFVQTGGSWASGYEFQLSGETNEIQVLGGSFGGGNGILNFLAGARGCKATFRDSTGTLQVYQNNVPLIFAAGAKDCSIVVSSNATLNVQGKVYLNNVVEDCRIEFRGNNPKLTIGNWSTYSQTYIWSLGSDDEANAEKTVALKFVLPKEPYASAPFYANAAKPVNLKKYTKIIVEEGDWTIGTDKTKTFYPLAYDAKSFNSEMTAELVASLNANATLPEGAALEYDSAKKVLGVRMPREKLGMMLIVQ